MNKLLRTVFIVFILFFVFLLAVVYGLWYRPLRVPPSGATITVNYSSSANDICNQLYQNNRTQFPWMLKKIAHFYGYGRNLRYGQYHLRYGDSANQLFDRLVHGTDTVVHKITFIPGWTFSRILQSVETNPNIRHTLKGVDPRQLQQLIGYHHPVADGLFYPDTYHFKWGNADVTILRQAYQTMQRILTKAWDNRAPNLPYQSAYQALIAASLIQTEVMLPSEKPMVASVIVNRLRKNMRLQIDTTVLFAMNKPYGTRLLHRNLSFKSPYNTYRVRGLPPSPIAIPGRAAIEAALHPARTNYIYYVAKGDGGHVFSADYKGQREGVRRYRQFLKQRKDRKNREQHSIIQDYFQLLNNSIYPWLVLFTVDRGGVVI